MKIKPKLVLLLLLLFVLNSAQSQLQQNRFEDIELLQKTNKKNVLVFIYTDWCKFCHSMKLTVFRNKEVMRLLNENFYFILLDAEERRSIAFNNTLFYNKPSGAAIGIHELAIALGTIKKQISYPTICIINYKNEIIFQHSGFFTARDFITLLTKSQY